MRIGAAISAIVHIAAVTIWLLLAGVKPFDPMTAEAITVDIVPSSEAPPPPKTEESPAPDTPPQPPATPEQKTEQPSSQKPQLSQAPKKQSLQTASVSPQQQQQRQPPPPPQSAQQVPAPPPPIPYTDVTQQFGKLVGSEPSDFDAAATASANISLEAARALREHLRTCSVLPRSISRQDAVKIVIRVAFLPDGRLAREPLLIEASASAKGPELMQSAIDALLACQPYKVLPADKYDEWRVLDLSFTPKDFKG